jgi:hypothetical protein
MGFSGNQVRLISHDCTTTAAPSTQTDWKRHAESDPAHETMKLFWPAVLVEDVVEQVACGLVGSSWMSACDTPWFGANGCCVLLLCCRLVWPSR